jgi:hypothetical protein
MLPYPLLKLVYRIGLVQHSQFGLVQNTSDGLSNQPFIVG